MRFRIQKITAQKFRRYGYLIDYPKKHLKGTTRNLWRIVATESKGFGWRIAYLIVRDKKIRRLEQHPYSMESFEPVKGKSLLYVASRKDPGAIQCFALDRPVILKKNIWHGIVTVSLETEVKLTENAKVKCSYWPLGFYLTNNP